MTTKVFWLGQIRFPFSQEALPKLMSVIIVGGCLTFIAGCVMFRPTSPVLHKPAPCNLSPVLNLQCPQQIDTLAAVPRTETIVENGINKLVGGRQPDEIKDWFYIRKGTTEYTFFVFYSEAASKRWYESEKKDPPVFREATENGLAGRVHYTEEPRADPEGGSVPMGYYISRADFRLHNIYMRVVTNARVEEGEKPQNDKLSNAVKELGQMLGKALNSGH